MTPSENLVSEVARACVAEVLKNHSSFQPLPDLDEVVEWERHPTQVFSHDPIDMVAVAQAAIAIVVQKAAEVARGHRPDSWHKTKAVLVAEAIEQDILALSDRSGE